MSPQSSHTRVVTMGFPRVSGDEPSRGDMTNLSAWFSPRERG